ncbi:AbrB/MazE/SpoVT family DNA-binding domain-containing protein [bacterium]|nr:AbrB/MazE/SpoVT family DNA-binding domain-containing protein [bacterium]MCI0603616.1 AbrB/MazE/SpoVT family DNA-binding domain-containing protein [bacterium]
MIKRLTLHGNSLALVIEKAILELLKIDKDTPLEIVTDGKNLIISPVKDANREKRIQSALTKINRRHSQTLRSLAK